MPHRFRAPSIDGGLLAEPPLAEAASRLSANRSRLGAWDHDFQGRRFSRLRVEARREALELSRTYLRRFGLGLPPDPRPDQPWVVTGHQPELFHPGVWVKNFAAASVARESGGPALNLIVDDDIPKGASIRVPTLEGGVLRSILVPFDEWARETPFEDWSVREEDLFASFPDRVIAALGGQITDPAILAIAPHLKQVAALTDKIGLRFAAARRGLEEDWGVRNWDVPLSSICESESFLWFFSHVVAHLGRFRQVHNDALARYRVLYKIRSKHHPVPALAMEEDWLEAPFWAWKVREPRRRPLMARSSGDSIQLRIQGDPEPFAQIPLGPGRDACCAVEQLRDLPARGIRLRTRALTTTMFARFFLGDLFLHGIGGAKYDELGDEVARDFLGIDPPDYLTLSLTLWPGLDPGDASVGKLREIDLRLRDLEFNPERHLDGLTAEAIEAIDAKRAAIAGPTESRKQRVARFFEIRRWNEALQGFVEAQRRALLGRRVEAEQGLRRAAMARNREYSFVVHPIARLRSAFDAAAPGVIAKN